jgi:glycosyltransferase involved in cell wall biosynthesis
MDNQKIILLTHEYPPKRGGAGVYCEELVHASQKLGISIEAWVPKYVTKRDNLRNLALKGTQDWICSYRMFKELFNKKNSFPRSTLLHVAEPGSLRAIIRFGWLINNLPKIMITIHGTELIRFCANPIEKMFFRKILKRANRIHVLSKFNKIELLKICPEIKDQIFLFPGAPARSLITDDQNKKIVSTKKIKILCVARIHPRKGQDRVLNSIKELPKVLRMNIECTFVGPIVKKGFYNNVKDLSENSDCKVEFLGDLPDEELKQHYQNSDIFILPSMPRAKSVEGFGFVYLEASSHGLPIIAHRIGGVEDAVKDGETGILADPERPKELKDALKRLLTDTDLRKKMGQAGKNWAKKHCWETVAKNIYSF